MQTTTTDQTELMPGLIGVFMTHSYNVAFLLSRLIYRPLTPSLPYISARYMAGENTTILMLLWCYINHCRDLHQIFSCLFETFGSMSEIMFSSDSMSKKYFFQQLKVHECLFSFSTSLFWNGWKTMVQNVRMTGIFLIYHC